MHHSLQISEVSWGTESFLSATPAHFRPRGIRSHTQFPGHLAPFNVEKGSMKHDYIKFTEPEQDQRAKKQMHNWCKLV